RLVELRDDQQAGGWILDEGPSAAERQLSRHHLDVDVRKPRLLELFGELLNRRTTVHRELDRLGKLGFVVLEAVLTEQIAKLLIRAAQRHRNQHLTAAVHEARHFAKQRGAFTRPAWRMQRERMRKRRRRQRSWIPLRQQVR